MTHPAKTRPLFIPCREQGSGTAQPGLHINHIQLRGTVTTPACGCHVNPIQSQSRKSPHEGHGQRNTSGQIIQMAFQEQRKHRHCCLLAHGVFRGVAHGVEVVAHHPVQLSLPARSLLHPDHRLHRWSDRSELAAPRQELEERFLPDLSRNHPPQAVEIAQASQLHGIDHEEAGCRQFLILAVRFLACRRIGRGLSLVLDLSLACLLVACRLVLDPFVLVDRPVDHFSDHCFVGDHSPMDVYHLGVHCDPAGAVDVRDVFQSSPDCYAEEKNSGDLSRSHCPRLSPKNCSRRPRHQPQTPAAGTARYHPKACDARETELGEVATAGCMVRRVLRQSLLRPTHWDPED